MKQLMTRWGKSLHKEQVWQQYPRPLLRRKSYVNLNGEWDYSILQEKITPFTVEALHRAGFMGKILVPFSPEAKLSGVERQLKPSEFFYYHRLIFLPDDYQEGMRIILHFGAVDQCCKVYINDTRIGEHEGGYLPFSFDITEAFPKKYCNLTVVVRDDSEQTHHARGKQLLKRGGMFYTAQSGIWQTVFMECVPKRFITTLQCEPDASFSKVKVLVKRNGSDRGEHPEIMPKFEVYAPVIDKDCKRPASDFLEKPEIDYDEENASENSVFLPLEGVVTNMVSETEYELLIPEKSRKLWTCEEPYLYHFRVTYGEDCCSSYFALRCFTIEKDTTGAPRICLNHKPFFQKGVLDQGYWPDGLYTPPDDRAFVYDILKMKELGFNMLRKHIKIEPQRFYYHCDRLGMIVWQDMVCGGSRYKFWFVTYLATALNLLNVRVKDGCYGLLGRKDKAGRTQFEQEMAETVRVLYNHPSIAVWVIFNEGWGQFDAVRMTQQLRQMDASRIIDSTSGWFDQGCGDLKSQHHYFFSLTLHFEKERATVLSEFGGFPYRIEGHSACEKVYGYHPCKSLEDLHQKYDNLMRHVIEPEIAKGMSASVYTQLSDVEEEVNGILTYDREVCKFDWLQVRKPT